MPFKRITRGKGRGKYRSPSGRVFTKKQVRFYYYTHGTFKVSKRRKRRRR